MLKAAGIVVFVWKYWKTRDAGLLWLVAAVVIWPIAMKALDGPEAHFAMQHGHRDGMTVGEWLSFFVTLNGLVSGTLLFVAALLLYRKKRTS